MDDTALPWKLRDWTTRTTLKIIGRMTQGSTQHYPENSEIEQHDYTKNHRTDDTRVNTALPWKLRDWTTRTTLKIIGRMTQGSTQHYPENSEIEQHDYHTKNHRTDGWHKGQHSTTLKTQRLNNTDHTKNHRTDDTRVNTALPWKLRDWTTRTTLKIIGRTTQGSTQHYPENLIEQHEPH